MPQPSPTPDSPAPWILRRPLGADGRDESLRRALSLHPLLARVLVARGFDTPELARAFLNPRLSDLLDPFALQDMDRAADRIGEALRRGERICVYGDYDVDGLTATAILLLTLRFLGAADCFHYIPRRLGEGYGMSRKALDECAARGARLLITVDNGINALDETAYARGLGMEVVITDHHQPGPALPEAAAVVNPNRADAWYEPARLSGAGVAFKLAHALLKTSGRDQAACREFLGSLLELIALGTLADMVPLRGENRILARWGLERLSQSRRAGLRALLEIAGRAGKPASSHTVGFILAPRLNAAGRADDPEIALRLLLEDDPRQAAELARRLDKLNEERRQLEKSILSGANEYLRRDDRIENDLVLIAEGQGWHEGVLGIVAARIAEQSNRPVLILSSEREIARGSARSFCGYNIYEALAACGGLLLTYGGHATAAGLSLSRRQLPQLRDSMNRRAREAAAGGAFAPPALQIDAEASPEEINLDLPAALGALEPHGQE